MPLYSVCLAYFFYASACLGRSGAYSVLPWCYVRRCVCRVGNQGLTNVTVDLKVYIHIYVWVSLGAHNFGYHHAIPFKFGMILI